MGIQYIPVLSMAMVCPPKLLTYSPKLRISWVSVENSFTSKFFLPLWIPQKIVSLCTSSPVAIIAVIIKLIMARKVR